MKSTLTDPVVIDGGAGTPRQPRRCWLTKLGIALFLFAALCFATMELVQFFKTGSFARGSGFVVGRFLATPMLVSVCASLGLLMIGGVVDSLAYGRWKKGQTQRA